MTSQPFIAALRGFRFYCIFLTISAYGDEECPARSRPQQCSFRHSVQQPSDDRSFPSTPFSLPLSLSSLSLRIARPPPSNTHTDRDCTQCRDCRIMGNKFIIFLPFLELFSHSSPPRRSFISLHWYKGQYDG